MQQPEAVHSDPNGDSADLQAHAENSLDPCSGALESCSNSLDSICRPGSPHVRFSDKVQTFIIGGSVWPIA